MKSVHNFHLLASDQRPREKSDFVILSEPKILRLFSRKVVALDLIYSISVSNPFLNLVMQLKCLYPVHSISALKKFHISISKSVTFHNFGFVQGQTLKV